MAANSWSSSSSSDDEEDSIPLSQLLRFPKTRKPSKIFNQNDIVFAEISPRTWSPAQITAITGNYSNTASISLFDDTHTTHSPQLSQICDFEDDFALMVKRVSTDEIDAALEELGQRAELGMMCSCRINPNVEPIGLASVFEPREMMGFVRNLAVCAWVGVDEIVKAVRFSAQVNGYRRYASVCMTSGVDEEFCAGDTLGFLKDVAVCWGGDDWENASAGDEIEQIVAYRRFVSLGPDWMYQQSLEIEDGSHNEEFEGNDQDASNSWSVGETDWGVTSELENDGFSTEIPKEDCEMYQEQVQECREICDTNKEDFSVLDLDDESMMNDPLEPIPNPNVFPREDSLINENTGMYNLSPNSSSQESDIDVEIAYNRNLPCIMDSNQMAVNGTESPVNEKPVNHVLENIELHCGMGRVLDRTSENDKSNVVSKSTIDKQLIRLPSADLLREYTTFVGDTITKSPLSECEVRPIDEIVKFLSCPKNTVFNGPHGMQNGAAVDISSTTQTETSEDPVAKKRRFEHDNTLLVRGFASESQIPSPNHSFKEHAAVSDGVNADQCETMETNTRSIFETEAVVRSVAKRRWDMPIAPNESPLQNSVTSSSTSEYSTCKNMQLGSASDKILSHDKDIIAGKLNNLASRSKENVTCGIEGGHNLAKHVSIGTLHKNRKRNQFSVSSLSDWNSFYASPLMRDETKSPIKARMSCASPLTRDRENSHSKDRKSYASPSTRDGEKSHGKARKPSLDDRVLNSFPKSLHMKFPRDFTLPSKQELEKKFGIFGPLDHSRTKVFTYTGAALVVFLRQASSYAAYKYVKKKNVFGQGNVRFWIDEYENYRKGANVDPTAERPSLDLKSCLRRPERVQKEKYNVRFQIPAS